MIIVDTDPSVVEATLRAGGFSCPDCGRSLRPWGYGIERDVRSSGRIERRRLRRAICRLCWTTHILLPQDTLLRRRDCVEEIGTALTAKAQGTSNRKIAKELGLHVSTVRGWLRSFTLVATRVRELFTRWAHALDPGRSTPEPTGSEFCDAVDAIGILAQMAVRRFGPRPAWHLASMLTRELLICNTSRPLGRADVICHSESFHQQ